MRGIGRRHRRIALAAVGQPFEQSEVSCRVMVDRGKFGHTGTRIGQAKPRSKAELQCMHIEGRQAHRAAHLLDQRERDVRRRGVRPPDPLRR